VCGLAPRSSRDYDLRDPLAAVRLLRGTVSKPHPSARSRSTT